MPTYVAKKHLYREVYPAFVLVDNSFCCLLQNGCDGVLPGEQAQQLRCFVCCLQGDYKKASSSVPWLTKRLHLWLLPSLETCSLRALLCAPLVCIQGDSIVALHRIGNASVIKIVDIK
eukprot:581331-Pelagomonas_calceolata.AAC.10